MVPAAPAAELFQFGGGGPKILGGLNKVDFSEGASRSFYTVTFCDFFLLIFEVAMRLGFNLRVQVLSGTGSTGTNLQP